MSLIKEIHCCGCNKKTQARLISGKMVYPHFPKLSDVPFWFCPHCKNWVGCHYKTNNPTRPLGCIPTPAIKEIRKQIHDSIDYILCVKKDDKQAKKKVYDWLSRRTGRNYHTALIRSVEEGREILRLLNIIKEKIKC